jgi:fatty acid desaturase
MDSNPATNNAPVGRPSLVAAIRGPIMLITVGVLFALDYSAGLPFWKTWPVLLIVIGVLHLMERRAGSHGETRP